MVRPRKYGDRHSTHFEDARFTAFDSHTADAVKSLHLFYFDTRASIYAAQSDDRGAVYRSLRTAFGGSEPIIGAASNPHGRRRNLVGVADARHTGADYAVDTL